MKLNVKKLHPEAQLPAFAHEGDAGMDLFCAKGITIEPGERVSVETGIAVEIPSGYVGLIWDKSGISLKHGLTTIGGVIDSGYRGEVKVSVVNLSNEAHTFEAGDKVAQMLIQKAESPEIEEVDVLSHSERGEGGFGSTGK